MFESAQGSDSDIFDQSTINRKYILALKKVKPEHAEYYRTLKSDLISQFGGANKQAQEHFIELKKLSSSLPELQTITTASGNLDAHSDIKQVKLIQNKLND